MVRAADAGHTGRGGHRVAVVGLGYAGEQHVRCFMRAAASTVAAVVDVDGGRACSVADDYGVVAAYTDYRDILDREDIDVVSICTPNHLHAPIAVAALRAGKHVLCIKPLARTTGEVLEVISAARESGRVLDVAYSHRSRSDVRALKDLVDGDRLGKVYFIRADWRRRDGIPEGAADWFLSRSLAGGGPLLDLGVHLIDLVLFLMGEPEVTAVSAATSAELMSHRLEGRLPADPVEDLGVVMMRLGNGGTVCLETSWALYGAAKDDLRIGLYGSRGGAEIESREYAWRDTLRVFLEGPDGRLTETSPELVEVDKHAATIHDFLALVQSDVDNSARLLAALRRARIVDACYESARRGAEVFLNREHGQHDVLTS